MLALISEIVAGEFARKAKIEVLPLKPYNKLDKPVCTHADMLISVLDDTVFCYEDYFEENKELFSKIKCNKIVKVKQECKSDYPNDIQLNVLVIGKKIFCKIENTAKEILQFAEKNGYKIINTKQGYSACSTLVIDEKTAITSDKSIEKALKNEKIDVLFVTTETITLDGYNCGFIGGSGGILEKTAYFFGDILTHPDYERIVALLNKKKISICPILAGGVSDFGGIKFIY